MDTVHTISAASSRTRMAKDKPVAWGDPLFFQLFSDLGFKGPHIEARPILSHKSENREHQHWALDFPLVYHLADQRADHF